MICFAQWINLGLKSISLCKQHNCSKFFISHIHFLFWKEMNRPPCSCSLLWGKGISYCSCSTSKCISKGLLCCFWSPLVNIGELGGWLSRSCTQDTIVLAHSLYGGPDLLLPCFSLYLWNILSSSFYWSFTVFAWLFIILVISNPITPQGYVLLTLEWTYMASKLAGDTSHFFLYWDPSK